ncbi:hypothetical protein SAMN05444396_10544 [Flavobacterium segetis]|uniref:Uncharacterized protein n=1 Tax=Flavobacterium segetis TaxID=271157 RepID=A0A1M5HEB4_9FLAO|nr:hypothetical protein [Flavobacterium segetis]SHG14257.1 hypothetical protein SAMN05444396_10544 [Flavobacterium segetis]
MTNHSMNDVSFEIELLDKHKQYINQYKSNDFYWGVGIENECYLEFEKTRVVDKQFLLTKGLHEKYSVNHFKNYKENVFENSLQKILLDHDYHIPVLMNSHSFTKTDVHNVHETLDAIDKEPNPAYSGESIFDKLQKNNRYFIDQLQKKFIFDGDTIEFVTQDFYKKDVDSVIGELAIIKNEFTSNLQKAMEEEDIFTEFGKLKICSTNHPFAIFVSNNDHYSVFNNMTYHFNLTIPTELNTKGEIKDKLDFIQKHQRTIRLFQWLSPLFMIKFGSSDYLSHQDSTVNLTKASQRCAMSRYIGIGTYDTDVMKTGKIVQMDFTAHPMHENPLWWVNRYSKISDYEQIDKIGLDINFHKHKNHGIEFRMFDYFEESHLKEVLQFLVFIMDHALMIEVDNPICNLEWNNFTFESIVHGKETIVPQDYIEILEKILHIEIESNDPIEIYNQIYLTFHDTYYENGFCSSLLIKKDVILA